MIGMFCSEIVLGEAKGRAPRANGNEWMEGWMDGHPLPWVTASPEGMDCNAGCPRMCFLDSTGLPSPTRINLFPATRNS